MVWVWPVAVFQNVSSSVDLHLLILQGFIPNTKIHFQIYNEICWNNYTGKYYNTKHPDTLVVLNEQGTVTYTEYLLKEFLQALLADFPRDGAPQDVSLHKEAARGGHAARLKVLRQPVRKPIPLLATAQL